MSDKDKPCYIFYAYKPYSAGRYDDTYDSDYVFEYEQTYTQVVEHLAKCMLRDKDLGYGEKRFGDITILKNGRSLGSMMNDNEVSFDECNVFEAEIEHMKQEAESIASSWYEEAKKREADRIAALARKEAEVKIATKRAMYESLKKEFEP